MQQTGWDQRRRHIYMHGRRDANLNSKEETVVKQLTYTACSGTPLSLVASWRSAKTVSFVKPVESTSSSNTKCLAQCAQDCNVYIRFLETSLPHLWTRSPTKSKSSILQLRLFLKKKTNLFNLVQGIKCLHTNYCKCLM